MKYRVIEVNNSIGGYQPQYLDEHYGWKTAYAEPDYVKGCYENKDDAIEACRYHAMCQPRVVWEDDF